MKPDEQQSAMEVNQGQGLNMAVAVGAGILAYVVLPPLFSAQSLVILQRLIVAGLIGGVTYVACKEVKCGDKVSRTVEEIGGKAIAFSSKKTHVNVTLVISAKEHEFLKQLKDNPNLDENKANALVSKYRWISYLSEDDWKASIERLFKGEPTASESDEYAVCLVTFELEEADERFERKSNPIDLSDALKEVGLKGGVKVEISLPHSLSDLPSGEFYQI